MRMSNDTMKVCPFCDGEFDTQTQNMKKHIATVHLGLTPAEFERKESISKPIQENAKKLTRGKTFVNKQQHAPKCEQDSKGELSELNCDYCGKTITKRSFKGHKTNCEKKFKEKYSGKQFQCDHCKRSFDMQYNLDRHQRFVHENITYQCSECSKQFAQKDNLKKHTLAQHSDSNAAHKFQEKKIVDLNCDQCSLKACTKQQLRIHKSVKHSGADEKSMCEYCGKNIPNVCLKKHQKSCEIVFNRKYCGNPFQCENCKKSFETKQNLSRHTQSVHNNVRYQCSECPKRFDQKYKVKEHTLAHHSESAAALNFQAKKDQDIVVLNSDKLIKSSTYKKKSMCEYCGNSIPTVYFKVHQKTCEKVFNENYCGKQYQCDHCKRSFDMQNDLDRHRQTVHDKITSYQCSECPVVFSLKHNLKRHILLKHHGAIQESKNGSDIDHSSLLQLELELQLESDESD